MVSTYIAVDSESPGEHDCRVALPGRLEAQDQAEVFPGLPEHRLRRSISAPSNTA
jgi:hypothetical protein